MLNYFHKENPTCFLTHTHKKTEYISPLNLPFIPYSLFTSSKKKTTVHKIYIHLTVQYGLRLFLQSGLVCTGNTVLAVAAALRWTNQPIVRAGRRTSPPSGFWSVHRFRDKNQVCPIRKNRLCCRSPGGWLKPNYFTHFETEKCRQKKLTLLNLNKQTACFHIITTPKRIL